MKIYINGRFITQRITGVQRYAWEMTKAMDALISQNNILKQNQYYLISPIGSLFKPLLNNIEFIEKGISKGHIWEQFELPLYTHDGFLINFCNCAPLLKRNQTVTIHDAAVAAMPNTFSWCFRTWYKLMFKILGKTLDHIFTVSNFSKKELHRYFDIPLKKISVTYNGIDHIKRIVPDNAVIDKFDISNKKYAFAVSSLNPSKNFKLILDVALKMPDILFVIAGGTNSKVFNSIGIDTPSNAKLIGYVTDEELIALYQHASVFLYPSVYEGFGIPPLEAMNCGCPVIVSDIEVFHEIYEDSAKYCEVNSVTAWKENINYIVNNEVDMKNIKKIYTWELQTEAYMKKLQNIFVN